MEKLPTSTGDRRISKPPDRDESLRHNWDPQRPPDPPRAGGQVQKTSGKTVGGLRHAQGLGLATAR